MWNFERNTAFLSNLMISVKEFELTLDSSHTAMLKIISSNGVTLLADSLRYIHPDLLCFEGIVDGRPALTYMHISQLSLTIVAVPVTSERPKRPISFKAD